MIELTCRVTIACLPEAARHRDGNKGNDRGHHSVLRTDAAVGVGVRRGRQFLNSLDNLVNVFTQLFISNYFRFSVHDLIVLMYYNAAGADGQWHSASGFSVMVSKNASSNSKRLAQIFTENATDMGLMGNCLLPR